MVTKKPKLKVRKGDNVHVIRGKDRGKKGTVMRVIPVAGRVVVEGINLVKRHVRPRRTGEKGQVVSVAMAVPISTVMVICPQCGRPTRLGAKRVCKKCQATLE